MKKCTINLLLLTCFIIQVYSMPDKSLQERAQEAFDKMKESAQEALDNFHDSAGKAMESFQSKVRGTVESEHEAAKREAETGDIDNTKPEKSFQDWFLETVENIKEKAQEMFENFQNSASKAVEQARTRLRDQYEPTLPPPSE